MTDQEHLEKMNYWDEDNETLPIKRTVLQGQTVFNYKKTRTREDRLGRFIPKQTIVKTPTKRVSTLKTGWSGIQAYFEQCARSEKQN